MSPLDNYSELHRPSAVRQMLVEILQQPIWDVEPERKLIRPGANDPDIAVEFYIPDEDVRYIAMPARSDQSLFHAQMTEERMPLFSSMYTEDLLLLHVPTGTRPVKGLLKFIARDVRTYGEIFWETGKAMRLLDDAGFGLPYAKPHRSLLEGVGYSLDEHSPYGGKIYLVPPYNLNPHLSFDQTLGALHMELEASRKFNDAQLRHLVTEVQRGWHGEA